MKPTVPKLCLASTSPRRREILESLGLEFTVQSVDIDESPMADEAPLELVLRLAKGKATAVGDLGSTCVIAADTVVVLDGQILGKPEDEAEAIDMLLRLSGRWHEVLTGVAVSTSKSVRTAHSTTDVQFREIGRDEALRYWQSGEPRDKAGAYGIQGRGGLFVEAIRGSYSGVVGLPVYETAGLLTDAGINLL
jgi:nucleoside triphosphate pyrophosphatase